MKRIVMKFKCNIIQVETMNIVQLNKINKNK